MLRPVGVEESSRTPSELRLSLVEGPQSSCIEIAAIDHKAAARLPADMPRIDRATLPTVVEAIVHKLHLTAALVVPVGHWRQLFDAVAEGMAANEKWRATDSEATIELNTRDALQFLPADFHILRDLVRCVLTCGTDPAHGIAIATSGQAILVEVMPAGEVVVYTGRTDLATVVRELVIHASTGALPAAAAARAKARK
ncbi:MAG: hypothetical protein EXS03_05570 [Phycisphaerales bacterium]|nr:hypothetical protein [Phycisphaerales bacterium]